MSGMRPISSRSKFFSSEMRPTDLDKYWKSDDEFSTVALYDLSKDPSETTNLATLYPELVKELLAEAELAIENAPKQTFTMVIYKIRIDDILY